MADPLPASPMAPVTRQKSDPISWPEKVTLHAVPPARSRRQGWDHELKRSFQRSWATAQNTTSHIAHKLSVKVRYLRRERPLQVIAGFAIAGLLAGIGLRIWRGRHE